MSNPASRSSADLIESVLHTPLCEVLGCRYPLILAGMGGVARSELVAAAGIALRTEATVEEIIRTIHAHPTMSEAIAEAAHAVHGAAIHS